MKQPSDIESQILLGTVAQENLPRLRAICESNIAPPPQVDRGMRLNPRRPLVTHKDWMATTITQLQDAGILNEPAGEQAPGAGGAEGAGGDDAVAAHQEPDPA